MSKIIIAILLSTACSVSNKQKQIIPSKEVMPSGDTLYSNKWDSMYILRRSGDTSFIVLPKDIENAKNK